MRVDCVDLRQCLGFGGSSVVVNDFGSTDRLRWRRKTFAALDVARARTPQSTSKRHASQFLMSASHSGTSSHCRLRLVTIASRPAGCSVHRSRLWEWAETSHPFDAECFTAPATMNSSSGGTPARVTLTMSPARYVRLSVVNSDATFAWPNVSCLPPGLNFDLRRDTAKTPVVPLEVVEVDVVVVPLVMGVGLLCVSGAPAAFSSAARAVACPGVSTSELQRCKRRKRTGAAVRVAARFACALRRFRV